MNAASPGDARLPLFHRPATLAFLDDDAEFLFTVRELVANRWVGAYFTDAGPFTHHLLAEVPFWNADLWSQQGIIDHWRQRGTGLAPQVLAYWSKNSERYAFTALACVDEFLPATSGVEVLRSLGTWPGARLLVTGAADRSFAVDVFNERLIGGFVSKQAPEFARTLLDAIGSSLAQPVAAWDRIWQGSLNLRQLQALRAPGVEVQLASLLHAHFREYVILGEPFGALGLDDEGRLGWAAFAAPDAGRLPDRLDDAAIRTAIESGGPAAHAPSHVVGEPAMLATALFWLDDKRFAAASHRAWRRRNQLD